METSFYNEHLGTSRSKKELMESTFPYEEHEICEETIVSFYEETYKAIPKDERWKNELNLVRRVIVPLDTITKTKGHLQDKLHQQQICEKDFEDFNMGLMDVLNAVNRDEPVDKFLLDTYIGCRQCLLCFGCNKELCDSSCDITVHLDNATSLLEHVLSEEHVDIPELKWQENDYKSHLRHLADVTKDYLKMKYLPQNKPKYKFLMRHKDLIKDYQMVFEMELALNHLRIEFEQLRIQTDEDTAVRSELTLFSKMEETSDLSSWCC